MQPTGFFSLIWESLKWKVHYSISSKGCEFQKPEQVTEMGEQGRVEAVISSALAVGWHDKDGFCQGKRWKYSIPFSISCTLRKAEVHTVIPKCLKAIHFSIPLSLQVTLRIMRLFPNNMLFSLQQDNFLHLGKCLKPRPDTLWKFLPFIYILSFLMLGTPYIGNLQTPRKKTRVFVDSELWKSCDIFVRQTRQNAQSIIKKEGLVFILLTDVLSSQMISGILWTYRSLVKIFKKDAY